LTSSMTKKKLTEEKKINSKKGAIKVSICFVVAMIIVMIYILIPESSIIIPESSEIVEIEDDYKPSINILVNNGCGVIGLAQSVSDSLLHKNDNFSVAWGNIANTQFEYEETRLVIRKEGDDMEKKLNYLKSKTGITKVDKAVKHNAKAEFELILGKDYMTYFK